MDVLSGGEKQRMAVSRTSFPVCVCVCVRAITLLVVCVHLMRA